MRRTGVSAAWFGALLVAAASSCTTPAPDAEPVVLVHGLGRTSASMLLLGARLEAAGYRAVPFDYPSTTEPIEVLVDSLARTVADCCADAERVHFVTHSMGGILVRSLLSGAGETHAGRVVMLSPPNQGSEIIDAFAPSRLLVSLVGPAGARLGTDSASVPARLGPVAFELGVIVGDRSLTRFGSWLIPGPDDGLVGVEQARVRGMQDFLVVPASHTLIMNDDEVARATVAFLETGTFGERVPDEPTPPGPG